MMSSSLTALISSAAMSSSTSNENNQLSSSSANQMSTSDIETCANTNNNNNTSNDQATTDQNTNIAANNLFEFINNLAAGSASMSTSVDESNPSQHIDAFDKNMNQPVSNTSADNDQLLAANLLASANLTTAAATLTSAAKSAVLHSQSSPLYYTGHATPHSFKASLFKMTQTTSQDAISNGLKTNHHHHHHTNNNQFNTKTALVGTKSSTHTSSASSSSSPSSAKSSSSSSCSSTNETPIINFNFKNHHHHSHGNVKSYAASSPTTTNGHSSTLTGLSASAYATGQAFKNAITVTPLKLNPSVFLTQAATTISALTASVNANINSNGPLSSGTSSHLPTGIVDANFTTTISPFLNAMAAANSNNTRNSTSSTSPKASVNTTTSSSSSTTAVATTTASASSSSSTNTTATTTTTTANSNSSKFNIEYELIKYTKNLKLNTQPYSHHYKLGAHVRNGGFSEIYEGNRLKSNEKVIIKLIPKHKTKNWLMVNNKKFPAEILLHKMCNGVSGVVRMLEFYEQEHDWIIIMPKLRNSMDLFDYLESKARGRLSEREACGFFKQLIRINLDLLNTGVVHRDIKSENLLVDMDTMKLVLIDFGASAIYRAANHNSSASSGSANSYFYTDFHGTRQYKPPEYITQKKYTAQASTIWTLGILLYDMCNGQLPFETEQEILDYNLKMKTTVSDEYKQLLFDCLKLDPDQRPKLTELLNYSWFQTAGTSSSSEQTSSASTPTPMNASPAESGNI